jgi:Tfp pilus assembly protein FimT
MVALVVFGILIAASVPAFRKYMATQQVEGTIHRLAANLRLARQSAAAERNNYKVTFNPTAKRYSMLDDDNNNGVADNGEMVLGPINIPAELTVTNGPALPFPGDTLVFYPNGSTSSTGTMTISNRKHYNRLVRVMRSTGAVAVR